MPQPVTPTVSLNRFYKIQPNAECGILPEGATQIPPTRPQENCSVKARIYSGTPRCEDKYCFSSVESPSRLMLGYICFLHKSYRETPAESWTYTQCETRLLQYLRLWDCLSSEGICKWGVFQGFAEPPVQENKVTFTDLKSDEACRRPRWDGKV